MIRRTLTLALALLLAPPAFTDEPPRYGTLEHVADLAEAKVVESSGLACSRRAPGRWWTHNDSGGAAVLYAFDERGRSVGRCSVRPLAAFDWEDMASCTLDGKPYLLVGDIGDNLHVRPRRTIHVIEEPRFGDGGDRPDADAPTTVLTKPRLRLVVRMPKGNPDIEALAVDPGQRAVYLMTKRPQDRPEEPAVLYRLPIPDRQPDEALAIERIATVHLPRVTGMDLSPDGRRLVVLAGGRALGFERRGEEGWAEALSREPVPISTRRLARPEAVAFAADGRTVCLTEEGKPCPLWRVPLNDDEGDREGSR